MCRSRNACKQLNYDEQVLHDLVLGLEPAELDDEAFMQSALQPSYLIDQRTVCTMAFEGIHLGTKVCGELIGVTAFVLLR